MASKPYLLALLTAAAALLPLGSAQAALQARDINHDGSADGFYDTDLNVTWLADAGLSSNSTFAQASSWASSMVVGGISGWRLPNMGAVCAGYNCTSSEMGHLFYVELASTAGRHMNAGGFQNLSVNTAYWSGASDTTRPGQSWAFSTIDGQQFSAQLGQRYSAMAVHSGDILAAVPEPETYTMLLAGLGVVGALSRRRKAPSA